MKALLNNICYKIKTNLLKLRKIILSNIFRLNQYIDSSILKIKKLIPIWIAIYWKDYYQTKRLISLSVSKYRTIIIILVIIIVALLSWIFYSFFNCNIESYFSVQERFNGFRVLLVTLGGAFIGATAISFSLVMFAMQVNVERMPHGLFRKFSTDPKLLGYFGVTFFIAISITCLSLIPDKSWTALTIFLASWGSILVILFLFIAYRRALSLINPTEQLLILTNYTKKNLNLWDSAARRMAPLLNNGAHEDERRGQQLVHDIGRIRYFQNNPGWTLLAEKSVAHCISFSRRYAENGDHEVAETALSAIVEINKSYINAKGKTFFSDQYFIENNLTTDNFINDTLEHLRKLIQVGISRGDEQQIEQTFMAILWLCRIYSRINYASEFATKSHAHLAATYLVEAVKSVIPHNMADVLMFGVRRMGESAQIILSCNEPDNIITITENISTIGCKGIINKKLNPVTEVAVMQIAKITYGIIRCHTRDVYYALGEVHKNMKLITEIYLKMQDTEMITYHHYDISPYYSCTNEQALPSWLSDLSDSILGSEENDQVAQRIIRNFNEWVDELYQTEEEVFLLAIEKKSSFTFDVINWIVRIVNIIFVISNADACSDYYREELQRKAHELSSILSLVPDNQEAVSLISSYDLSEKFLQVANIATNHDRLDIAMDIYNILLSWAFMAGKYETGRRSLTKACYALACLNLKYEFDDEHLFGLIAEKVAHEDSPDIRIRTNVSEEIRRKASALGRERNTSGLINNEMGRVDQARLRNLLLGIADQLVL